MPFKIVSNFFTNAIVKNVDAKVRNETNINVRRRIFAFEGDAESVVQEEIAALETKKLGIFIVGHYKNEKPNSIFGKCVMYRHICERSTPPSGKSAQLNPSDLPKSTRANGCRAYVNHQFYTINNVKICVQRLYTYHNGHNPDNPEESRRSRICENLKEKIHSWFQRRFSVEEILERCLAWSKSKGQFDTNDRRYYPSDKDLQNLKRCYYANMTRKRKTEGVRIENLCKTDYKNHLIFFQPSDPEISQPMLIVLQTEWQRDEMKKYGNETVFLISMDIGVTVYDYAMYAIVVRNDAGEGVPVCFAFMDKPTEELIYKFFYTVYECLVNDGFLWRPDACVLDVALKDTKCLNELFDNQTSILLCWYQVIEAVVQWLMDDSNGLRQDKTTRDNVLQFVWSLKHSSTLADFDDKWSAQISFLPDKVSKYLFDEWKFCSAVWSNFGIRFYPDFSDPEIDRFFMIIKQHFVENYSQRSLDDMIKLLTVGDTLHQYSENVDVQSGTVSKASNQAELDLAVERVKDMLVKGFGKKVSWRSHLLQIVPSFSLPEISYKVNVVESSCTCPQNADTGIKCKHVILVEQICISQQLPITVDQLREKEARNLFRSENFAILDNYFLISNPSTGFTSLMDIEAQRCFCMTSRHGDECLCIKTYKLWGEADSLGGAASDLLSKSFESGADEGLLVDRFFDEPIIDRNSSMQRLCNDILVKLRSDAGFQPTENMVSDLQTFHSSFVDAYYATASNRATNVNRDVKYVGTPSGSSKNRKRKAPVENCIEQGKPRVKICIE